MWLEAECLIRVSFKSHTHEKIHKLEKSSQNVRYSGLLLFFRLISMTYDYLRFVDNISTHFFVRLWAHKLWFTTQAFYVLSSQIERKRKHPSESRFLVCVSYIFLLTAINIHFDIECTILLKFIQFRIVLLAFFDAIYDNTRFVWRNIEYAHTTVEIHNADNILLLCRHVAQLPQSIFHPFISPRMCKYLRGYCKNMIAPRTH